MNEELELDLIESSYLNFHPSPRDYFFFNSTFQENDINVVEHFVHPNSNPNSKNLGLSHENQKHSSEELTSKEFQHASIDDLGIQEIDSETVTIHDSCAGNVQDESLSNISNEFQVDSEAFSLSGEASLSKKEMIQNRLSELDSYRKMNNERLPESPKYLFCIGDCVSAQKAYTLLEENIRIYMRENSTSTEENSNIMHLKQFQLLKIAVASILIYVQQNQTGPKVVDLPQHPFVKYSNGEIQAHLDNFEEQKKRFDAERWKRQRFSTHWEMRKSDEELQWFRFDDSIRPIVEFEEEPNSRNEYAIQSLNSDGEFAYKLALIPHYLLCAKTILFLTNDNGEYIIDPSIWPSSNWWRARILLLQQQLLPHSAGSLFDRARNFFEELNPIYGEDSNLKTIRPELTIRFYLEYGNMHHLFMRPNTGRVYFEKAKTISGLWTNMTGFLGKRTKFQTFKTSLLVLQAKSKSSLQASELKSEQPVETDSQSDLQSENHSEMQSEFEGSIPRSVKLDSDNPMLEQIETENEKEPVLEIIDQVILLALCLNVKNRNPEHGLTVDEMSPFIYRVELHPSNWMVHSMALLLKSRIEAQITKFAQRSLFQLEELVNQFSVDKDECPPEVRMEYVFQLSFPAIYTLRKELGDRYFECGGLRTAQSLYEKLELWPDVVRCLYAQDKPKKATEIVEARLKVNPNSPELWDLYGTVINNPDHYYKAWELSNHSFALAMRNLGNYYMNAKQWANAVEAYQKSLKLNYMHQRSWFACGCGAIQIQDWKTALQCFSTAVQLDPDDAESWTNLSSIHMTLGYNERAIKALREALRLKPDNYQMWDNHLILCIRTKDYQQVITSLVQLLRIRPKEIDLKVLRHLVGVMERMNQEENKGEFEALVRRMDMMWEEIKSNLSQNPNIWELNAIYNEILGRFDEVIKSRQAQIRSLKVNNWQSDKYKYERVCEAVEEAARNQINIQQLKLYFPDKLDQKLYVHGAITMIQSVIENEESVVLFSNTECYKKLQTLFQDAVRVYDREFEDC